MEDGAALHRRPASLVVAAADALAVARGLSNVGCTSHCCCDGRVPQQLACLSAGGVSAVGAAGEAGSSASLADAGYESLGDADLCDGCGGYGGGSGDASGAGCYGECAGAASGGGYDSVSATPGALAQVAVVCVLSSSNVPRR